MEWVAFVFGLCIGSFLNVCIYRLPLSKSIVHPRSACPNCGHPIRACDNIPVASYLMLRGRCRDCGVRIPVRYPLVELLSGAFAAMAVLKFGAGWQGLLMYGVIAALLVITFIDIDHRVIPDLITLPGIPIGVAAGFGLTHVSPLESLIGVLVGGGSLLLVAWGYQLITKREGMGGGDIKLLAMIGAFFGWQGVLFTIFVASLSGSLAGLALMLRSHEGMKLAVPFGPFLAVGALGYMFIGPEVLAWYIYWIKH